MNIIQRFFSLNKANNFFKLLNFFNSFVSYLEVIAGWSDLSLVSTPQTDMITLGFQNSMNMRVVNQTSKVKSAVESIVPSGHLIDARDLSRVKADEQVSWWRSQDLRRSSCRSTWRRDDDRCSGNKEKNATMVTKEAKYCGKQFEWVAFIEYWIIWKPSTTQSHQVSLVPTRRQPNKVSKPTFSMIIT